MKKILVFSNRGKLFTIEEDFAKRSDVKILGMSPESQLLHFNESNNLFSPVKGFSSDGLYFVFDRMEEHSFYDLINISDRSGFFILKHTAPQYINGFINVQNGRNASKEDGGLIYPDVINILQDDREKKVDRIFKIIFKTDQVKELKIKLVQSIQNDELPDELPTELIEFQPAYDKFKEHASKDWLSKDYSEAFETFLNELKMEE